MQTQNYVYNIFGFEEIWLKVRARAFWEKMRLFDSKSLIALEHFSWHSWNKYELKKFTSKGLNVRARAQ